MSSTHQVDNITNAAGSGAPTFPYGLIPSVPIAASGSASGITVEASRSSPLIGDTQNVYSGTYTPTFSNGSNTTPASPGVASWSRVGNVVTVCGSGGVTSLTGTDNSFQISLPISRTTVFPAGGAGANGALVAIRGSVSPQAWQISGSAGSTTTVTTLTSQISSSANYGFNFTFQYQLS